MTLHRRLARDYETLPACFESMIHLTMTDLLARRLTGEATFSWHDPTSTEQIRITGWSPLPDLARGKDEQRLLVYR